MRLIPYVAVENASTVIPEADIDWWTGCFQNWVAYHLRPAWNVACHLERPQAGHVYDARLVFKDTSDVQGALGYHYWDATQDHPVMVVFAKTCQRYGASVTVCATHELGEYLCDQHCTFLAQNTKDSRGVCYALEVGDPVEADAEGIQVTHLGRSALCSNAVTPAWFDADADGPYDLQGKCSAPFEVMPGGYVSLWDGSSWSQRQMQDGTLVAVERPDPDEPRVIGRHELRAGIPLGYA